MAESLADAIEGGIAEYNPDWKRDKTFPDFCEHITQRRMSKEGRFYRVHFKRGATVDLVPPGSLASGWNWCKMDEGKLAGGSYRRHRHDGFGTFVLFYPGVLYRNLGTD